MKYNTLSAEKVISNLQQQKKTRQAAILKKKLKLAKFYEAHCGLETCKMLAKRDTSFHIKQDAFLKRLLGIPSGAEVG